MSDHTDNYNFHPIGPWRVERVHEETVGDTGCAVGIDRITDARDRSTWRMWMRTRDGVVHPQCDAKTRKAALDAMKREAAWITREARRSTR